MSKDPKRPSPIGAPLTSPSSTADSSLEDAQTIAGDARTDSSNSRKSTPGSSGSSGSVGSVGAEGPIPSAPTGDLPKTIGRYRILGKLGEGGMGIVYEAEQQDPRRKVALKVVRGGRFVDESTIRMFRREAETLARLQHPNIGGIYESGRTEDGQHFFAMELVIGENLDKYLAKRPKVMTPEEIRFRLALFRRIADAVHYAHQRGVIHRDLKPSNIIISRESGSDPSVRTSPSIASVSGIRVPDLKILDFGLARITEGDVHATQVTEVGVIKGTLPYMSPEQARGNAEAIDVRTDVYALGVILYEMLSSSKPYDVSRASLMEAVRVICEEQPRSLRNSISGTRRIDPDIETVVGKALEKDAERRYGSAWAMAEDIERYLASQPILARPPSTMYQLQKFASRNRALVAGLAAVFVVLTAGIVVSSLQAVRAGKAEALAKSRMERAESAEALASEQRRDAEAARVIAEQQRSEAETQKAVAEVERSVASSQRLAAEASGKRAYMEAAKAGAINRFLQDMLATADPWAGGGGKVTLDAALERAQTRIGTWAGTDPEVDYALRGTVSTGLAGVGKYTEAESLLQGGIQRLAAEKSPKPALVAGLHRELGGILVQTSRYELAETEFRKALDQQAKAGNTSGDAAALIMSQLAASLAYQGRYAQADTVVRRAMELVKRTGQGTGLANASILRTRAYIEANWKENYTGADSLLRQSVGQLAAREGSRTVETSEALEEQANNRVRMGDLNGADSLFRQAVSIRRKALGENHPLVARALENQGTLLLRSGRTDQTIEVLRQVLTIRQKGLGLEALPVGRTWVSLAPVYAQANRFKDSELAFDSGLGILRKKLGDRHPDVASALKDYADLRMKQKRLPDAVKLGRESLAIREERLGASSAGTVASQLALADMLRAWKSAREYPEAERLLLKARNAASSARGAADPGAVRAAQSLVALYDAWGKTGEAAKWRAALPSAKAQAGARSAR